MYIMYTVNLKPKFEKSKRANLIFQMLESKTSNKKVTKQRSIFAGFQF